MTSSTLITDYMGRGTHAARPASPNVPATGIAIYYETDTANTFVWNGSAWVQINGSGVSNIVWDLSVGMPALSTFTQINISGTSSVVENSGKSFSLTDTGKGAEEVIGFAKAAPATPYRIAVFAQHSGNLVGSGAQSVIWGFSDGTKFETFGISPASQSSATNCQYAGWSNSTTISTYTNYINSQLLWPTANMWLGIRDDGSNIYFEVSADGANYSLLRAQAHGFLSAYTYTFFGIENRTTTQIAASFRVYDPNGLRRTVP